MWSKFRQINPIVYDHRELSKLPEREQQMLITFGTFVPQIASFPHCIIPDDSRNLQEVFRTVDCMIGIWGNAEPDWDAAGEPFIPPEDGDYADSFTLWELPENQGEVIDFAKWDSVPFRMLIDSRTPIDVLHRLFQCDVDYDDYDFHLDRLSEFIEELRWAYVALEHEGAFALFVAAPDQSMLVDQIRETLQRTGRLAFSLARRGERWYWDGPSQKEAGIGLPVMSTGDK